MSLARAMLAGDPLAADRPVGPREAAVLIGLLGVVEIALAWLGAEVLAATAILALFAYVLLLRDTATWVIVVILAYLPVFWQTTDDFTLVEIAQSVLQYGGMLWWWYRRVLIERRPIRWTPGTILCTASFLYALCIVPMSVANDADPLFIVRELVVYGSVLLCLPIRDVFTTPARQWTLIAALLSTVVPIAVKNMVQYQERVISAAAFWEVGASRQTESYYLFFVASMLLIALIVTEKRLWLRLLYIAGLVLSIGGAILTFYRSIWVTILLGFLAFGLILGWWYWRRLALYAATLLVTVAIGLTVFFQGAGYLEAVGISIADRFLSVGAYGTDPSLINRNIETAATVRQTGTQLLVGHGIGSRVVFRNYITGITVRTTWNHNGYTWLLFHVGIVGALLAIAPYFWYFARALRLVRRARHVGCPERADALRWRAMLAACAVILGGHLFVSVTSNQFLVRDAALATAVIWGLIEVWTDALRDPARVTRFPAAA